jgi:GNAT superfamily N-acetyltransferase
MTLSIRPAVPDDSALIGALVRELATYEKLIDHVEATPAMLAAALFTERARVFCDIAEWRDGEAPAEPVGFALWFYNFSTFGGRHGIYLEDLFVRPAYRGKGIGKALLARLARRCIDERLGRLDWSVLDWNEPAIAFYKAQGAVMRHDWTGWRISGDALARLAVEATKSP